MPTRTIFLPKVYHDIIRDMRDKGMCESVSSFIRDAINEYIEDNKETFNKILWFMKNQEEEEEKNGDSRDK